MTSDEYWHGDPSLIYNYEKAFENKRKLKEQEMWLMGVYVQNALSSVPLNVAGFIEKESQLGKYPECPHTEIINVSEPPTKEQQELYERTRNRLISLGLFRE